jgi:hypothetical protein
MKYLTALNILSSLFCLAFSSNSFALKIQTEAEKNAIEQIKQVSEKVRPLAKKLLDANEALLVAVEKSIPSLFTEQNEKQCLDGDEVTCESLAAIFQKKVDREFDLSGLNSESLFKQFQKNSEALDRIKTNLAKSTQDPEDLTTQFTEEYYLTLARAFELISNSQSLQLGNTAYVIGSMIIYHTNIDLSTDDSIQKKISRDALTKQMGIEKEKLKKISRYILDGN